MASRRIDQFDLVALARRQRELMFAAGAMLLTLVVSFTVASVIPPSPMLRIAYWTIQTAIALAAAVVLVRLYLAMGESTIVAGFTGLLLVIPVIGLLILLTASSRSSTILKLAGVKVGLLGVSTAEREKLRPRHCRACGYSRESLETLAPCPECGRIPIIW